MLTFTASSFGRRASDGGANLHIFHQQHSNSVNNDEEGGWSQPGSREQLQPVSVLQTYISNIIQMQIREKRNNENYENTLLHIYNE